MSLNMYHFATPHGRVDSVRTILVLKLMVGLAPERRLRYSVDPRTGDTIFIFRNPITDSQLPDRAVT